MASLDTSNTPSFEDDTLTQAFKAFGMPISQIETHLKDTPQLAYAIDAIKTQTENDFATALSLVIALGTSGVKGDNYDELVNTVQAVM